MSFTDATGLAENAVMISGASVSDISAGMYVFASTNEDSSYLEIGTYATNSMPTANLRLGGATSLSDNRLYQNPNASPSIFGNAIKSIYRLIFDNNPKAPIPKPDEAFFWSNRTDGIGGPENAEGIAKARGGKTLEMLLREKGIPEPPQNDQKAWDALSEQMAANASGDVKVVLGSDDRPVGKSTWERKEYKGLIENKRVSTITSIDPKTQEEKLIYTRPDGGQ